MKEINENQYNEKNRWRPRKQGWKRFFMMVSAGIIGSVFTLATVIYTPILEDERVSAEKKPFPLVHENQPASYKIEQTSSQHSYSFVDMIEKASKTIVGITNFQHQPHRFSTHSQLIEKGAGSGVIFKIDGQEAFIVTNNHVIEGAENLEVTFYNGDKTEATLVGADALSDLAVLKIDAKYVEETAEFGDSDQLKAGEQVIAIGNPLGLEFSHTVTQGIVSAVNRSVKVNTSAGEWELNVIQTDAAINPGNSGGALLNTAGQLVGINSLKIADSRVEGLGFAIPINDAIPLIDEMIKNGKVERPYMGVSVANLDQLPYRYIQGIPMEVDGGVMVMDVDPDSTAAEAGVQPQDIIVAIDDYDIKSSGDVRKFLYSNAKIGDEIALTIYRGNEQIEINVLLK